MDVLESVIRDLTSDEVRRFKILSNRFKADEEKKLIILFDAIRSETFESRDDALIKDLYKEVSAKTKNRFYRLRNKLLDNLEKSLCFYHFKYKDSIHAYYDLQLSILFRERGNYDVSHYFLKKAEKKAVSLDQFNVLELIYGEYVQLALKNIRINIEPILDRRRSNFEKLRIHRKNTETIAIITQRLKKSNFSRMQGTVVEMLNDLRKRLQESAEIFTSPEGRILIFRTVSTLLIQKKAYPQLVDYLEDTIKEFEQNQWFTNDNHSTRLLMRLWLCNSLFKMKDFSGALENIELLEEEMEMYDQQNYYTYLFNFYNLKINVQKCLGDVKGAEKLLEKALNEKQVVSKAGNRIFLLISKADFLFNKKEFEAAIKVLEEVKSTTEYLEMDEELVMFLGIFEMVNYYESGDYSFIQKQFKPFRKQYRSLLKSEEHTGTYRFLEILNRVNDGAIEDRRISWKQAYNSYLETKDISEPGSNSVFIYEIWLKSKVEGKPYYKLFVEEMTKS